MPKIFLSYRRDDSAGHAGRLYDHLRQHFGPANVFMDIDTLEPGADFVAVVERTLDECQVLLAVVGPRWLSASDPGGSRRLDKEDDFVRLEIETALSRSIRTIPVLVQAAQMPAKELLPAALAPLTRRHAIELTDARWGYDVGRLIDAIKKVPDASAQPIVRRHAEAASIPPPLRVVEPTQHTSVLKPTAGAVALASVAFVYLSIVYGVEQPDLSVETYQDHLTRVHGVVRPASFIYFPLCLMFFLCLVRWPSSLGRKAGAWGAAVSVAMTGWSAMLSNRISFNEVFAAWIAAALVLGGIATAYVQEAGNRKQEAGN